MGSIKKANKNSDSTGKSNTAKLIDCLEQGGERLKDEAVGLSKRYINNL